VTRIGFRPMISCFMLGWGCVSTAMMLIKSPTSFFVLRFTLGAFEAGFTPAVFLYITQWYPEFRRGRVLTLIVAGAAFAGVVGGPISGAIISGLQGYGGLSGWQWMFVLQGMPAVLLGFAAYGILSDRPSEARWLTISQRSVIEFDLAADRAPVAVEFTHFSAAFCHPLTYVLGFIYFTVIGAMYVVTFWLPTILAELSGRPIWQIGLLSALPFVAALLAQYPFAYSSDHFNERRWHLAICGVFGSVALIATIWTPGVGLTMLLFCVATSAFYAMPPVFFTLPPRFFSGSAAAASIAMITSIGQLGGFASSYAAGFIREVTHKTAGALLMNAALLCIGMLSLLLFVPRNARDQT
jgi:MFS family permease